MIGTVILVGARGERDGERCNRRALCWRYDSGALVRARARAVIGSGGVVNV